MDMTQPKKKNKKVTKLLRLILFLLKQNTYWKTNVICKIRVGNQKSKLIFLPAEDLKISLFLIVEKSYLNLKIKTVLKTVELSVS